MTTDGDNTCGPECGCRTERFPTAEKCPHCGSRLALSGRTQRVQFRLACGRCGYQGPLLSQQEVRELL